MKKYLQTSLFLLLCTTLSAQKQSDQMTAKFFPEPTFQIQTPTNQKPFAEGLCTYEEMMAFLQSKVKSHSDIVRMEMLGKTPGGKEIPILFFGDGKNPEKLRVWLQGGIHGNEPAGTEGLFMIINHLLETPEGALLLKKLDIAMLPVANVDGYIAQKRTSADGFDLNRDQTKFADPVSPVIKSAFIRWNPEASFDFHEYTPLQKKGTEGILNGNSAGYYDVLFLPSGNLNVPKGLRKMSAGLFETNAEKALEEKGYSHNFYFTPSEKAGDVVLAKGGNNPRSSSSNYALSNSISILIEIRGIGLGRTSYARRTYCSFLVAKSLLETASSNIKEVKKVVKNAIKETVDRKNLIAVTANETMTSYPVKFIDVNSNEAVTLDVKVKDALLPIATLQRKRPVAYILTPECKAEAGKMEILGIQVTKTLKPLTLSVNNYTISSYDEEKVKWEGIFPVNVQTKLTSVVKTFPAGSFVVRLDQKYANYAVILLEPESENGFVNMAITKTALGKELPVYRFEKGKLPN
ncbi:MAG: M14 family metallocarboxypeptidase [Prolixibacteraceae bacterium]